MVNDPVGLYSCTISKHRPEENTLFQCANVDDYIQTLHVQFDFGQPLR